MEGLGCPFQPTNPHTKQTARFQHLLLDLKTERIIPPEQRLPGQRCIKTADGYDYLLEGHIKRRSYPSGTTSDVPRPEIYSYQRTSFQAPGLAEGTEFSIQLSLFALPESWLDVTIKPLNISSTQSIW